MLLLRGNTKYKILHKTSFITPQLPSYKATHHTLKIVFGANVDTKPQRFGGLA